MSQTALSLMSLSSLCAVSSPSFSVPICPAPAPYKKCPLIKIKRKISLLAWVIKHSVPQCVCVCVSVLVCGNAGSASPCLASSHLGKALCVNCFLLFAVCFFCCQNNPAHIEVGKDCSSASLFASFFSPGELTVSPSRHFKHSPCSVERRCPISPLQSSLSPAAHTVPSRLERRIGLSYYTVSCLFDSVSTSSQSIDSQQCRPPPANTYIFIFLLLSLSFFPPRGSHPCAAVAAKNAVSDLCAGSWLQSRQLCTA